MDGLQQSLPTIFFSGFAVQRLVQIADPLIITPMVQKWVDEHPSIALADAKQSVIALISTVLGMGVSAATSIPLFPGHPCLNIILGGLLIGAGTEGANTVLKYMGYAKDAQQGVLPAPDTANPSLDSAFQYRPLPANHPMSNQPFAPGADGELPETVDLRPLCLPVRNQESDNACSGFATAAFRELSHAIAAGAPLADYLSPAYLWARGRMLENQFPVNIGVYVADELGTLVQYGVCPESLFPYDQDPGQAPSSSCDIAAEAFRITGPSKVDYHAADKVKAVLARNQPIAISFSMYPSFKVPDRNGVLRMFQLSEPNPQGHAVLVCGYTSTGWIVRNSFGVNWGDQAYGGYGYMPYGYEACWHEAWTAAVQV